MLEAQVHAAHVDGHDAVELVLGDLGDRLHVLLGAGVVERDVQPAEGIHGLLQGGLDAAAAGDVAVHCQGTAAGLFDQRGGLLVVLVGEVGNGDGGAFTAKASAVARPMPVACPGAWRSGQGVFQQRAVPDHPGGRPRPPADGPQRVAETARAATFRFAKEIGHDELIAWSYEMQAWFALTDGRHSDVTSIAKAAQTIGGENSAIVQLIMQEARGWAKLGNRNAAESAMERGYNLLQKLPPIDYPRHFVYDRSKYPFYAASCYQWLGDYDKAEEFANEVIRNCEANGTTARSPMRLAEVHITLGLIQAQRGNLEAAVDSGIHALTYERKSGPSLLIRATELGKAITQRFPGAPLAVEFDERLRSVFEEFQYQPPEYG